MKPAKLDLSLAAAKGCCTPKSLAEFKERADEIRRCPGWQYPSNDGYISAYEGMLKLGEFCSCKLIVLGERIAERRIWELIFKLGKFTLQQRRAIGEAGTWDVLKLGPIFQEPFERTEVLAYATKVNYPMVWAQALETNTLWGRDIQHLIRYNNPDKQNFLAPYIIRTGLLREQEVRGYIRNLKHYQLDAALAYLRLRKFSGQKLLSFAAFLEGLAGYPRMENFWDSALKQIEHGLSRKQLMFLLDEDERKRQNWQDRYSEKLHAAVVKTGLLSNSDLAVVRKRCGSKYVQNVILDVVTTS